MYSAYVTSNTGLTPPARPRHIKIAPSLSTRYDVTPSTRGSHHHRPNTNKIGKVLPPPAQSTGILVVVLKSSAVAANPGSGACECGEAVLSVGDTGLGTFRCWKISFEGKAGGRYITVSGHKDTCFPVGFFGDLRGCCCLPFFRPPLALL